MPYGRARNAEVVRAYLPLFLHHQQVMRAVRRALGCGAGGSLMLGAFVTCTLEHHNTLQLDPKEGGRMEYAKPTFACPLKKRMHLGRARTPGCWKPAPKTTPPQEHGSLPPGPHEVTAHAARNTLGCVSCAWRWLATSRTQGRVVGGRGRKPVRRTILDDQSDAIKDGLSERRGT